MGLLEEYEKINANLTVLEESLRPFGFSGKAYKKLSLRNKSPGQDKTETHEFDAVHVWHLEAFYLSLGEIREKLYATLPTQYLPKKMELPTTLVARQSSFVLSLQASSRSLNSFYSLFSCECAKRRRGRSQLLQERLKEASDRLSRIREYLFLSGEFFLSTAQRAQAGDVDDAYAQAYKTKKVLTLRMTDVENPYSILSTTLGEKLPIEIKFQQAKAWLGEDRTRAAGQKMLKDLLGKGYFPALFWLKGRIFYRTLSVGAAKTRSDLFALRYPEVPERCAFNGFYQQFMPYAEQGDPFAMALVGTCYVIIMSRALDGRVEEVPRAFYDNGFEKQKVRTMLVDAAVVCNNFLAKKALLFLDETLKMKTTVVAIAEPLQAIREDALAQEARKQTGYDNTVRVDRAPAYSFRTVVGVPDFSDSVEPPRSETTGRLPF